MDAVPLPIPEDIRDLLADLTNKIVIVDSDRKMDPTELDLVARYVSDTDELIALSCWNLAAAGAAGGAFAMVPWHTVDDIVGSGELDELLTDCFYEVANIASRWLHRSTTPHLRLTEVHTGWREDERALLANGRARGFVISIEGYSDGKAACVAFGPAN